MSSIVPRRSPGGAFMRSPGGVRGAPSVATGEGFNQQVYSVALLSDGRIVCGGVFTEYKGINVNRIAILHPNGALDTSFDLGQGFNGTVRAVVVDGMDRIYCGGLFTEYDGTQSGRLARIAPDGSYDTDFPVEAGFGGFLSPGVASLAIQPNGRILCGGTFTSYKGQAAQRIAVIDDEDAALNTVFDTSSGFNNTVWAVTPWYAQLVLAAGDFTQYGGVNRQRIAALDSNGTLVSGFNTASGFNDTVYTLSVEPSLKVVAGGFFRTYKGVTRRRIARINTDASLDTVTFQTDYDLFPAVRDTKILSDGKILCGGDFIHYNETDVSPPILDALRVARLNFDGTYDTSFDSSNAFNSTVNSVVNLDGGKILCGGQFIRYGPAGPSGIKRERIARLNADGSLDTTFG